MLCTYCQPAAKDRCDRTHPTCPQTSELQAKQDLAPTPPATGGFWARLSRVALLTRRKILELGLAAVRRAGQMHTQLHLVDAPGVEVELWAQDLGEPIFLDGVLT